MVNLHIQKDNPKVVHAFDMEDLGDKAVYCRCWRSKKVREEGMGPVLFMVHAPFSKTIFRLLYLEKTNLFSPEVFCTEMWQYSNP